jgi:hypothetical protein
MSSVYTKPGARTIVALHTSDQTDSAGTSIRKLVFPDLEKIDGNLWLRANHHEPSEFPKLREIAASGTGTIKRNFYNDVPCVPWPETLHQTLQKLRKIEGRIVAYTIRSPVFLTVNSTVLHANWLDEIPLSSFDENSDTAAGRGDCLETHQMNYILTKLGCKLGDRFKRETEFFEGNLQTVKQLMANKPQ